MERHLLVALSIAGGLCGCAGAGPQATGALSPWRSSTTEAAAVPPLPTPRANHCSAAANGRLYVLGGNHKPAGSMSFVALDDVQVAEQQPDGALVAWRKAGSLPGALTGCTATSDGQRLYVVGGLYEEMALGGRVWAAAIQPDGALAAFTDVGLLPPDQTVVQTQAFVRDQTLVVFNSTLSVDKSMPEGIVVLRAPLGADGAPGAWTVDRGPAGFRGRPQYAATTRSVFALGGYLDGDHMNEVVADGFGAPFSPATGLGASAPSPALPAPRAFGAGVGVDDWVFVLGGKTAIFNGSGQPEVYAAHATGDAAQTLGAFTTLAQMPEGRTNLDAAVVGDYLYVTGGGSTGGGLDNVFVAKVRFTAD